MKHVVFLISVLLPLLVFAQPTEWQSLVHRLPGLDARRLTQLEQEWLIEVVEPSLLKMTHKQTGLARFIDISDSKKAFGNHSSNDQVIDLINADTSLYAHLYTKAGVIPVAGTAGYPLIIGDFNQNNKLDFAGSYFTVNDTGTIDAAIAEMNDDTTFTILKRYDLEEMPIATTDLNNDGLLEMNFKEGAWLHNLTQTTPDSLPDSLNIAYRMWDVIGGGIGLERFVDLDKDGKMDLLYKGADTLQPWGTKLYVAEYDSAGNAFEKKFSIRPPTFSVSEFCIDDFDNDGFTEFAMGSIFGDVFVIENTGNDSYEMTFVDTISANNAYLSARTNDIDRNGKPEFFIGGTGYYNGIGAARVYWFESDGDNSYKKVRSFYLLGGNILGFYRLFESDVNADGVDDLIFAYDYFLAILVWNPDGYFDLFYYLDWFDIPSRSINSVNLYDIFQSEHPALLINYKDSASNHYKYKTLLYKNNFLTAVKPPKNNFPKSGNLFQNYPNPFNPVTTIRFSLSAAAEVELSVMNIRGQVVAEILDERRSAGEHSVVFDASGLPSGIYFYRLTTGQFSETRKMVVVR